jgi:purine-binding chemotaxis protein CheW
MRVGVEHYALPVEHVLEIAELGAVTPVPGSSAVVLGVRNLRGQVLPVFRLASLFGIGGDESPAKVVVAELAGRKAGLAIDEVTDVGPLAQPTDDSESAFLRGSALDEGQLVGVIDIEQVFAALEERAA